MAVGAVVGAFPILGTTTVICFALAFVFRLNIAAIQILNYVVYPIQLALIIPFIRFGERMFGATPLPLSLSKLVELFDVGTLHAVSVIWRSLLYGAAAWALVAPFAIGGLYLVLLPMVRHTAKLYATVRKQPGAADTVVPP